MRLTKLQRLLKNYHQGVLSDKEVAYQFLCETTMAQDLDLEQLLEKLKASPEEIKPALVKILTEIR